MEERPEYIPDFQVAKLLGITDHMLEELVEDGVLPCAHRIGKKKLLWAMSDIPIMTWLLGNQHRFKTEPKPSMPTKRSETKD